MIEKLRELAKEYAALSGVALRENGRPAASDPGGFRWFVFIDDAFHDMPGAKHATASFFTIQQSFDGKTETEACEYFRQQWIMMMLKLHHMLTEDNRKFNRELADKLAAQEAV